VTRDAPRETLGTDPASGGVADTATRVGVAASFWIAIALPLALVAVVATGIEHPIDVATFLLLVGANGTALVVGRGYAATDGDSSS